MINLYLYFYSQNGINCRTLSRAGQLNNELKKISSEKFIIDISVDYPDIKKINEETRDLPSGIYLSPSATNSGILPIEPQRHKNEIYSCISKEDVTRINVHKPRCYVYFNENGQLKEDLISDSKKLIDKLSNPVSLPFFVYVGFQGLSLKNVELDMEPLNKLYFSRSAAYCFMDEFHNFDLDKKLSICNAIAYEHSSHSEIEDSSEKENVLKDSKVLVDYQWSVEAVSLFRKENILYIFDLIEFTKMSYYPLSRKAKFINEFDDYFKVVHGITLETAQKINIRAGLERKGPNDYKILGNFSWSQRTINCFENNKIVYLSDLLARSTAELMRIPNFGKKTLREVERFFDEKKIFDELTNNSPEEYERLPDVELISSFEWSQRAINFFKSYDLVYLSELIKKSSAELLRIPNFGRKTLKEVEQFLELQNTFFGDQRGFSKNIEMSTHEKRELPDIKLVENFNWSKRTINCFTSENITYFSDLLAKSTAQLLRIPNFGRNSFQEVKEFLKSHNTFLNDKSIVFLNRELSDEEEEKKIKQKAEAFDNIFEFIDREIETLSGRNLQLIKQRYYDELTLEEVGSDNRNKLTRERVRQIEKTFFKKTLLNHGSLISVWKNNLKSRIEILVSPASLKFVESISGYSNSLKNIGQLKLIFKHLFEDEFFIITFEDDPYVSRVKQEEFDKYTDQLKASIKSQIGTSIQNIEISCKASCPPLLSEFFPYLFTKIKNENMVISGNSDEKVLRSYHDRRNSVSYALETVIDQINQEISNQELESIQKSLFPDIDWRSFSSRLSEADGLYPFSHGTWGKIENLNIPHSHLNQLKSACEDSITSLKEDEFHSIDIVNLIKHDIGNELNEFKVSALIRHFNLATYAGRNVFFKFGANKSQRESLKDIAVKILSENGKPMLKVDLEQAIKEKRNFSGTTQYIFSKPIISLPNGMMSLEFWDNSAAIERAQKDQEDLIDLGVDILSKFGRPMPYISFNYHLRQKKGELTGRIRFQEPFVRLENGKVALTYWDDNYQIDKVKEKEYLIKKKHLEILNNANITSEKIRHEKAFNKTQIDNARTQRKETMARERAEYISALNNLNPRSFTEGGSWTIERTNKLVDLAKDGLSANDIARTLGGTTRNAVIGKLNRLLGKIRGR